LKENLIKIMLIADDEIRFYEYMKLITEILKYISEVHPEKPSKAMIKNLSNKYSCNLKPSF
jgi:cell division protein FtsI/penicillin-binding protein 2